MKAYALHRIQDQDEAGERVFRSARSVFETSEPDFKRLLALGAVRHPTQDEIDIANAEAERNGDSSAVSDRVAHADPAKVNLSDLKKDDLLTLAAKEGVDVQATDTKAVLIEKIEKARADKDDLGV